MQAHLRVARPTDNLGSIVEMYREGLDLEVLGSFQDHEGFDGVMLGRPGMDYHLEFTSQRGKRADLVPNAESLLVFYEPDPQQWDSRCSQLAEAGFKSVASHNPYWDARGRTFEDIDGCRIVLQCATWS